MGFRNQSLTGYSKDRRYGTRILKGGPSMTTAYFCRNCGYRWTPGDPDEMQDIDDEKYFPCPVCGVEDWARPQEERREQLEA